MNYNTMDIFAMQVVKKQALEEMFHGHVPSILLEQADENPRRDALLEWLNAGINKKRPLSSANSLVYEQCHGILYHITKLSNIHSITLHGIRPKQSPYRNFSKRLFCFVVPPSYNYQLQPVLREVLTELQWEQEKDTLALVKINLHSKNTLDFYTDDAMMSDNTCYTFTTIPPSYIEWIKPISTLC